VPQHPTLLRNTPNACRPSLDRIGVCADEVAARAVRNSGDGLSHRDSIGPRRRGRRHRLYQHAVASRTPLVLVIVGVMGSLLLLVALSAPL